jgi:tRNA-specific 2-thiouridylase
VLFGAPRERLAEMLLPIGGLQKTEVRRLAREFGLPVFDKPDSQEICFVPDNDYAGLVTLRTPDRVRPGAILDLRGRTIGEHPGHQHFTIGQRKGVGVALGHAVYVVKKDSVANTITVGEKEDLRVTRLTATDTNWLVDAAGTPGLTEGKTRIASEMDWRPCTAKFRYNTPPVPAEVRKVSDGELEVRFTEPQHGIAAGQAVVCYDGEAVMCGGWIRETQDQTPSDL